MQILKWIFVCLAVVSATPFDRTKSRAVHALDRLVHASLPSPQQALLIKQAKRLVFRLAMDGESGPMEAIVAFISANFSTLDNRQLTVLNNAIRSAMDAFPPSNGRTILELAMHAQQDLDLDLMQFPGFYTMEKQQALSRIFRALAAFCTWSMGDFSWLLQGDIEELSLAAEVMEIAGQALARVSEEHQMVPQRTFVGANICYGPHGDTKTDRMEYLTRLRDAAVHPEAGMVAVRWARILETAPMTLQALLPLRISIGSGRSFDPVKYMRLADVFEAVQRCSVTEALFDHAVAAFKDENWEHHANQVMEACGEHIAAHEPTRPAGDFTFPQLAILEELRKLRDQPTFSARHEQLKRYLDLVMREQLHHAPADLARLRRVLVRTSLLYTPMDSEIPSEFLSFVLAMALNGYRILASNTDALRLVFPNLTEGAIGHLRVIAASVMALNFAQIGSFVVSPDMTEAQLERVRIAIEGLATAYRRFHQESDSRYIDFAPLALLGQTDFVERTMEWLKSSSGGFILRRSAKKNESLEIQRVRTSINEWISGPSTAGIMIEDFTESPLFLSVLARMHNPEWVSLIRLLPSIIFNSKQQGMGRMHIAVVDIWIQMVETLYHHPIETVPMKQWASLTALSRKIVALLCKSNGVSEHDYEGLLNEVKVVLDRIRADPRSSKETDF